MLRDKFQSTSIKFIFHSSKQTGVGAQVHDNGGMTDGEIVHESATIRADNRKATSEWGGLIND